LTTSDAQPLPAIVVGSGFGTRIHVPALRAAGFEVRGLVGTDPDRTARRAARKDIPQAYTDLETAIRDTGAVAVTVATPPATHKDVTVAAIRQGCHVICEKPFATDSNEAREMLQAAEMAGVVHLVGNEFRWSPERNVVIRAIADGLIGEPRMITFLNYNSLVADPNAKMPRWWFDRDAGGGWLGAQGSHLIDQLRTWCGDVSSLSATMSSIAGRDGGAEDSYSVRFQMVNGADGVMQQTAGAWGAGGGMTRLAGTSGTLWVEGDAVWLADQDGSRQLPVPPEFEIPEPTATFDPRELFSRIEIGPYTKLCEHFRERIQGREGDPSVVAATFADGLAATEVMDAIRHSAANDGALIKVGA
jgi:predicted dehydrogenase